MRSLCLLMWSLGMALQGSSGPAPPIAIRAPRAQGEAQTRPVEAAASSAAPVDEIELEEVELAELRDDPSRWLGRRVRFDLQLEGLVEAWLPYLSRFGPADWSDFRAWPDERFAWVPEVYHDPLPYLFVRRGGAADRALRAAPRYGRFATVGVVREVFLDEPWIEIEFLHRLPEHLNEGSILHVERAIQFVAEGKWETALDQLERAKAAPLPEHVIAEIDRLAHQAERGRAEARESE